MNYSTLKKTVALSAVCMMALGAVKAQTTDTTKMMSSGMSSAKVFGGLSQYNTWSIGANVGVTSGLIPFAQNSTNHFQGELGYGVSVRDQLSHFFSLELNYYGGKVEGDDQTDPPSGAGTSKFGGSAFTTKYNSVFLSGVIDFGSVSFLHRENAVDFYGTAGGGMDYYKPTSVILASGYNAAYPNTVKGLAAPVGVGIKFKLSDALALNVGYTVTFVQAYNFSGFHTLPGYGAPASMDHYAYTYAGLEYTFGPSSKKNLDWVNPVAMMYDELYDAALRQEVEALKGRVTNVENAVADLKKDSDGDGVSDQFDKCPNTPAGTVVDGAGCPIVFPKDTVRMDTTKASAFANIQFEFDSSVLRTSSYPTLDATSAALRASGSTIVVAGYASSEGTAAHNMRLSRDRANSVKTYLVNSGVEAKHLRIRAFGETHPIADNSTEQGRITNRRVEFHQ